MNTHQTPSSTKDETGKVKHLDGGSADELARQHALVKISRRYAAYIVPAALAVLSNSATAAS
jgi:hypothetical protein